MKRHLRLMLGIWTLGVLGSSQGQTSEPVDVETTPVEMVVQTPRPTASPTPASYPLEKAGPDLLKDRPWLNDLYSWQDNVDLAKGPVEASKSGAYCIGNGRAFALIGLNNPLWTWTNLYGASYQEPDLGGLRMNITRAGLEVACPKQQIGWVRRSGVVKTHAEGKGLVIESYDFAPVTGPEEGPWNNTPVLVRMVRIVNRGDRTEDDVDIELKIQPAWNAHLKKRVEGKDLVIEQKAAGKRKPKTLWRLGAFEHKGARIWDDNLHYSLPTLAPGEERWAAFYLLSTYPEQDNRAEAEELRKKGALALLDRTRSFFLNWFERGTTFSGDPKITDLFEIESVIYKCVQSHSGGYSPLVGYSYTWIRDNNGPIRWFLKTGHPDEAKKAMDFFYGVGSTMGSLPNSIRVDYQLNYHMRNLSNIHVEHAETPNWIVLQHWWYYLTTGDLELVRARWNYLKRCLLGQVNVDDQYFFHRDETYLWCLESRIFEHVTFPNYYLSTFAFSTDSSFDLVAAADHLAYLGKYLEMDKDVSTLKKLSDRVRGRANEVYWNEKAGYWAPAQSLLGPLYNAPFANVLLNPYWCGFARNDLDPIGETPLDSQRALLAIKSAYPWLGREDGFWKTTPTVDFFVGMNPGQLLYDLCKARSPWAAKIYPAVLKSSSPSGEFAEMYDGQYHPWNPPNLGIGTSGRVRPWEGGLNTESVLEYLTGFAPDAGNGRVVFSPHLPEEMQSFGAQRLLVGPAKVSIDMKRSGSREWVLTLHLERGEQLEVTLDLWPTRRALSKVEADRDIVWDKSPADTTGHQARCTFILEADKDRTFTVKEGSVLPEEELEPPRPKDFQPDPYEVAGGDLLLLTSPTAILNQHHYKHIYKYVPPEKFIPTGKNELDAMKKVTRSVDFLDMDLPISPDDIAHGLMDPKGGPKCKLAVFGRGVFSCGKHHFKPILFWAHPKIGQAFKRYLEAGGCLFLGPSYPNREVLPDWLINLTGGGWEEGTLTDKVTVADSTKMQANQKFMDEIDVAGTDSENSHAVTFTGETFEDTQKLPDSQDSRRMIEDQGRGFSGYYQFAFKTEPGFKHRLWMRVNTGHNIKGMALQVQVGDQWKQVGVRTQGGGTTRQFLSIYFDIPQSMVTSKQTLFRLVPKTEEEVNAYHLWMYKLESGQKQPLAQILGFAPNQEVGQVSHGLLAKGNQWKAPLLLSQHPEQAAVLVQKIGKGYLIRSELSLEDASGLLRALLKPETLEALEESWPGS